MRIISEEEKKIQSRMPVLEMTEEFVENNQGYFCIPGHRFERGMNPVLRDRYGEGLFRYDLTETDRLDDLHHAEGPILEAQQLAASLYGSDRCFFLVNGTTCGNEAMILTAAAPGEKILVSRNSHKSVTMGLILSGAVPVWLEPEINEEFGFADVVSPEKVREHLERDPEIRAVCLVSPTYYGTCSDLRSIAEICHSHGVPLLVDEAHGSHLYFHSAFPEGALEAGADAVVQSTHKTLGSLTQTSMLHLQGSLLDPGRMDENLKLVMSTSPSYVFMAAMDAARQQMAMEGETILEEAFQKAEILKKELKALPGYRLLQAERQDPLRIVLSAWPMGIGGEELQRLLYERGKISLEMSDHRSVVLVLTWGNTIEELQHLIAVLREIHDENRSCFDSRVFSESDQAEKLHASAASREWETVENSRERDEIRSPRESDFEKAPALKALPAPDVAVSPREAYYRRKETVPLDSAAGRIAAELAAPYPPGIPVLCPGERITEPLIRYLKECVSRNCSIHGPADDTLQTIRVLR